MSRKMLVLGALPTPCEGTWVPLGGGLWACDFSPKLASKVRLEIEDLNGEVHSHMLQENTVVTGRRCRVVILEEVDADVVNIGITRVR